GAAGIDKFQRGPGLEPPDQVARALEVNTPVIVRTAAAGGNAVHDPFKRRGQSGQALRPGDVADERFDSGGEEILFGRGAAAQSGNVVSQPDEFRSKRQPDITSADDQYAHRAQLSPKTRRRKQVLFSSRFAGSVGLKWPAMRG